MKSQDLKTVMKQNAEEAAEILTGRVPGGPKRRRTSSNSRRSHSRNRQTGSRQQGAGRRSGTPTRNDVPANPETMEPCKTREEFFVYAVEPFTQIEGKGEEGRPGQVYVDSEGHPTIGIGHLVVHKGYVLGYTKNGKYHPPSSQAVAEYRRKFIELPLLDKNERPLTEQEKGLKYDQMINMMKSKKRALTSNEIARLDMGHLNEDGMHKVFSTDVEWALDRALKDHGDKFWEMTRSTQASLVHGYFWGKGRTMSELEGNPQEIGSQMPWAVRQGRVDPNRAIRRLADQAAADSTEVARQQQQMIEFQLSQNHGR